MQSAGQTKQRERPHVNPPRCRQSVSDEVTALRLVQCPANFLADAIPEHAPLLAQEVINAVVPDFLVHRDLQSAGEMQNAVDALTLTFEISDAFNAFNDRPLTNVVLLKLPRSEEHTSELQSRLHLVCRLLLEKKKKKRLTFIDIISRAHG